MDSLVSTPTVVETRARELFEERFQNNARSIDRLLFYLIMGQWVFAIFLAVFLSPYAWAGKTQVIHEHVYLAVFFGALINLLPIALAFLRPGWLLTRMVLAVAQMLWSGLLIHLSGGRIETHFHIFVSLAIIAFYRDWRVLLPATVVIAADHLLRQMLWPESVFGVLAPESWRSLEHVAWVAFEDVVLVLLCVGSIREMKNIASQQAHIELTKRLEAAKRLEQEMRIASRIQTSILPRELRVPGLEIAAKMIPATEVGGDYYDVLPVKDGCWIGIGDVAGHGLSAGLVMFQAQSAIAALVGRDPDGAPCTVLADVNRALYENVRHRLRSDEHVTMSIVRYFQDGRIVCAGAHEEALIWRAATRTCQRIPVTGTWLAVVKEIGKMTVEVTDRLAKGDLLVLYTDGVTEGRNSAGEQFGIDRLCEVIEKSPESSVTEIRDRVLEVARQWAAHRQDDDVTLLVFRHLGTAQEAAA
jgi:serine phosphatase RsbU (regulator of sigma subunit)